MIGAHVCSHAEIESQEYHAGACDWTFCVACASSGNSLASLPKCHGQVYRSLRRFTMRRGP